MCYNGTLHQKHKHPKKETFLAEPQQCIQHLAPGWKWYHQPFNAEIPTASCNTQNSKISLKEILPFLVKSMKWMLNVLSNSLRITHLISFASVWSKQLSYDSCDNCHRIAVTAFPNSWDSLSKQLWQLTQQFMHYWFFHIWLKPKPTKVTTFLKILSFSATLSPVALTWNSKNTLKLKHTIFC